MNTQGLVDPNQYIECGSCGAKMYDNEFHSCGPRQWAEHQARLLREILAALRPESKWAPPPGAFRATPLTQPEIDAITKRTGRDYEHITQDDVDSYLRDSREKKGL